MYYATGLPGWMRFGFSPGWIGRSPTGLGPTASYLMTGQWPVPFGQGALPSAPLASPSAGLGGAAAPFSGFNPLASVPKDQQVKLLEDQAKALESQLEGIRKRLEELRSGE